VINYRQKLEDVRKAIQFVRRSSVPHEFSVMPVPSLVGLEEIMEIINYLSGSRRLVIERFNPSSILDPSKCGDDVFSDNELRNILDLARPYFGEVTISL
jgi:hypothetical protein